MFEEVVNNVIRTKDRFDDNVRDSFGAAIVSGVMEPLETEERRLQNEYTLAREKMFQIKSLTCELRLIL